MGEYICLYQVKDKNGEVTFDGFVEQSRWEKYPYCFSRYVDFSWNRGQGEVIVKILKKYEKGFYAEMLLTNEQVLDYFDKLNKTGFVKNSIQEETDYYLVTLKEQDYKCKSHMRIALDFVRLAWEKQINRVLDVYYNQLNKSFVAKYNGKKFFELLQMISIFLSCRDSDNFSRYGHSLPCNHGQYRNSVTWKGKILTVKELEKFFQENRGHSYGSFIVWGNLSDMPFGSLNNKMSALEHFLTDKGVRKLKRGRPVGSKNKVKAGVVDNSEKEMIGAVLV